MAAPTSCVELLGSLFPDIDPQISNYVTGECIGIILRLKIHLLFNRFENKNQ